MSAGVYVLEGTGATVQVFPSQVHPAAPVSSGGGGGSVTWEPPLKTSPSPREKKKRRVPADELVVLRVI